MKTALKAFAVKVSLALAIAGGLAAGGGLAHSEPADTTARYGTIAEWCESAPEALAPDTCGALATFGDNGTTVHPELSFCDDGWPALVDPEGFVYGDQDGNGILAGEDCLWS